MANETRGRKSMYESHVKPFFETIEELLNGGASEKIVAKSLGISYSAWNKYKQENPELRELCEKPRPGIVDDLRSTLIKRAMGFTYEEKKIYKKMDEDGKECTYTEITTKYALPDVAALNLALKNYDKDNWRNDPALYELKRQELELKKMMAEAKEW